METITNLSSSYYKFDARPCNGADNDSIIIQHDKNININQQVLQNSEELTYFMDTSNYHFSSSETQITRLSSVPEIITIYNNNQKYKQSHNAIKHNYNKSFKLDYDVNIASTLGSNNISSRKKLPKKYEICQNDDKKDCCCSCNSEVMFEIMKGLYYCYANKKNDDCSCMLCRRLSEIGECLEKLKTTFALDHIDIEAEKKKLKLVKKGESEMGNDICLQKENNYSDIESPSSKLKTLIILEDLGNHIPDDCIPTEDVTMQDDQITSVIIIENKNLPRNCVSDFFKGIKNIERNISREIINEELSKELTINRAISEKSVVAKIAQEIEVPATLMTEIHEANERIVKRDILVGKTPMQDEKVLRELAMQSILLPEGRTTCEKKLIDKVRADLGLPPTPKTAYMKKKYAKAADEGLLLPLEGKTWKEKDKILKTFLQKEIPLPAGRTASEKTLIAKIKSDPRSWLIPQSAQLRKTKAAVLIPSPGKEKLPKKMKNEKLIKNVCPFDLPVTPKTALTKTKYTKRTEARLLQPLEKESLKKKDKILCGLDDKRIPLPTKQTPQKCDLSKEIKVKETRNNTNTKTIFLSDKDKGAKAAKHLNNLLSNNPEKKGSLIRKSYLEVKQMINIHHDSQLFPERESGSVKDKRESVLKTEVSSELQEEYTVTPDEILKAMAISQMPLPETSNSNMKNVSKLIKKSRYNKMAAVENKSKTSLLFTALKATKPLGIEENVKESKKPGFQLPKEKKSTSNVTILDSDCVKSLQIRNLETKNSILFQEEQNQTSFCRISPKGNLTHETNIPDLIKNITTPICTESGFIKTLKHKRVTERWTPFKRKIVKRKYLKRQQGQSKEASDRILKLNTPKEVLSQSDLIILLPNVNTLHTRRISNEVKSEPNPPVITSQKKDRANGKSFLNYAHSEPSKQIETTVSVLSKKEMQICEMTATDENVAEKGPSGLGLPLESTKSLTIHNCDNTAFAIKSVPPEGFSLLEAEKIVKTLNLNLSLSNASITPISTTMPSQNTRKMIVSELLASLERNLKTKQTFPLHIETPSGARQIPPQMKMCTDEELKKIITTTADIQSVTLTEKVAKYTQDKSPNQSLIDSISLFDGKIISKKQLVTEKVVNTRSLNAPSKETCKIKPSSKNSCDIPAVEIRNIIKTISKETSTPIWPWEQIKDQKTCHGENSRKKIRFKRSYIEVTAPHITLLPHNDDANQATRAVSVSSCHKGDSDTASENIISTPSKVNLKTGPNNALTDKIKVIFVNNRIVNNLTTTNIETCPSSDKEDSITNATSLIQLLNNTKIQNTSQNFNRSFEGWFMESGRKLSKYYQPLKEVCHTPITLSFVSRCLQLGENCSSFTIIKSATSFSVTTSEDTIVSVSVISIEEDSELDSGQYKYYSLSDEFSTNSSYVGSNWLDDTNEDTDKTSSGVKLARHNTTEMVRPKAVCLSCGGRSPTLDTDDELLRFTSGSSQQTSISFRVSQTKCGILPVLEKTWTGETVVIIDKPHKKNIERVIDNLLTRKDIKRDCSLFIVVSSDDDAYDDILIN